MFGFIKKHCVRIYNQITEKLSSIFFSSTVDDMLLENLEDVLLKSDVGVSTTTYIMDHLRDKIKTKTITDGATLKQELSIILESILASVSYDYNKDTVFLFVGINGSGKTTSIPKLATHFKKQGKKVLLVAADTFRAAAVEQLATWAQHLKIDIEVGKENQDPAAVVFTGCQKFKQGNYNILLIDTAGRLQTKSHLMAELSKIKRVVEKQFPGQKICTVLTVDAMLGQNSLQQAKIFQESTQLNGIMLTKLDGTGKGGVVFAIAQELKLPVLFVSFGEQKEDFSLFDDKEFVHDILNK